MGLRNSNGKYALWERNLKGTAGLGREEFELQVGNGIYEFKGLVGHVINKYKNDSVVSIQHQGSSTHSTYNVVIFVGSRALFDLLNLLVF